MTTHTAGKHDYALVMAGGSGTRLWPLSRKNKPKQFQKLVGDTTLLQTVYDALLGFFPQERILVIASENYWETIQEQLPNLDRENFISEPEARDTGPAFAYAAAVIEKRDPKARMGVFYADNFVRKSSWPNFYSALAMGFEAFEGNPNQLLLVGVPPLYVHTGLGYMEKGEVVKTVGTSELCHVNLFVEKPEFQRAKEMIDTGNYLWNTGYKMITAQQVLTAVSENSPAYQRAVDALRAAMQTGDQAAAEKAFLDMPRQSFEYLVTERCRDMFVLSVDLEWSDVGDWDIIHRLKKLNENAESPLDAEMQMSNVGKVVERDCTNTLVVSHHRPVVAIGLDNVVVVETADAVLVMNKDSNQQIKTALKDLLEIEPELS